MYIKRKKFLLFLLLLSVVFLSGCATLGPLVGGAATGLGALIALPFKLLGVAVGIAKKVPWWMWL